MQTTRVTAPSGNPVWPSEKVGSAENIMDLYIAQGRIGQSQLSSVCYSWGEVLRMAAIELW